MRSIRAFRAVPAVQAAAFTAMPQLVKGKNGAELPALPFEWQRGCAPVFSARQMELHYTKHHKAYVDKLNTILGDKSEGKAIEDIAAEALAAGEQVTYNQAAQHFNHSFYFGHMTPNASDKVPAELEAAINAAFGDVAAFKAAFKAKAIGNFGSGWTWLVYDTAAKGLTIVNTSNAAMPVEGLRPVMTMDVWEHAYYKDFENRRPDYADEFWKVVNWEVVAQNFTRASQ